MQPTKLKEINANLKLKFTINNKKSYEATERYQRITFYFTISISRIMKGSRQKYKSLGKKRASLSPGSSFYAVIGEMPL